MRLFYSYSSADESLRRELEVHLSLLKREGLLETWSFRDIDAGSDWEREIDDRLASADIVLLLVSATFIASRYCWEIELERALQRADRGETLLVPVVVRPCDWQTAPFARFQMLPSGAKPVISWRPRDRGWVDVVGGIRRLTSVKSSAQATQGSAEPQPSPSSEGVARTAREIHEAMAEVERRRGRSSREIKERRMNLLAELPRLYEALQALVAAVGPTPPILLSIVVSGERCTLSTDAARVIIEPSDTAHALLVKAADYAYDFGVIFLLRLVWFGNAGKKWRARAEESWTRKLTDEDEWRWANSANDLILTSDELARHVVKTVTSR